MSKTQDSKAFSIGVGLSIIVHTVLIGYLIMVVRPPTKDAVPPRKMPDVVMQIQPPPPPPPPPPKEPPKPQPPKPTPPVPRPTPIRTQAPADVPLPTVPPAPPPEPPAPPTTPGPAPSAATGLVTGASFPPGYLSKLTAAIKGAYRYPPKAAREGQEGTSIVHIKMLRDGTIVEVTLKEKSGFLDLDKEAKDVVLRIGKFPPLPDNVYPGVAAFEFDQPINASLAE